MPRINELMLEKAIPELDVRAPDTLEINIGRR